MLHYILYYKFFSSSERNAKDLAVDKFKLEMCCKIRQLLQNWHQCCMKIRFFFSNQALWLYFYVVYHIEKFLVIGNIYLWYNVDRFGYRIIRDSNIFFFVNFFNDMKKTSCGEKTTGYFFLLLQGCRNCLQCKNSLDIVQVCIVIVIFIILIYICIDGGVVVGWVLKVKFFRNTPH